MAATTPINGRRLDGPGCSCRRDERGFALAIAIFALVLLAAVVAGGYFTAMQEFQIGRGMRSVTTSFYAGEAAVHEVLDDWDPMVFGALAVGDSVTFGPTQMPGGGSYTATVVRVGVPADSIKRYFYVEAVGRPRGPNLGARRQAVVVRAMFPDICCDLAAATALDSITFVGHSFQIVDGHNHDPPGVWPVSACAGLPAYDVAGALIDTVNGGGISHEDRVAGQPDILYDILDSASMLTFNGLDYDDLAVMADHKFTDDHTMYDSDPTLDASGACDGSNPNNWGETDDPAHPCFDHFPIIHTTETLHIQGPGSGQGILLADEGIIIEGPYDFYGIAISKHEFEMRGATYLWGGAIVTATMKFRGSTPRLYLSQCAVERAQRLSQLGRPRLVTPRSWVELF